MDGMGFIYQFYENQIHNPSRATLLTYNILKKFCCSYFFNQNKKILKTKCLFYFYVSDINGENKYDI